MEKIGIYQIDEKYQVHGIIGKDGFETYNPFNGQKVLPFWGTLCTTFSGLNEINQKYLEENCEKIGIDKMDLLFTKFWLFWFCDGSLENQKELFFMGPQAKIDAHKMLHIFNTLLEMNIDKLIASTKESIKNYEEEK